MVMNQKNLTLPNDLSPVVQEIRSALETARGNVARQVNSELLSISDPDKRSFYERKRSIPAGPSGN